MICKQGLGALLRGSTRQLGMNCWAHLHTGNLVRNAVFSQQCHGLNHQIQASRNIDGMVLMRGMSCVAWKWIGNTDTQRLPRGVLVVPRRSSGHSKWQNIKHVKEANDNARAVAFSKLAMRMKAAVHEGKSPDPKLNSLLAHVVDDAKRVNMPMSKIESIIKAAVGSKDAVLIPFIMEAKGPGGTFFIIELLTNNTNRSRGQIKFQLSRLGVVFVDGIKHLFKHKGVVDVDPMPSKLTLETAVDIAIETGAEDVMEGTDDDGANVLQFLCEPRDFYKVKNALIERGYTLKSSKLTYLPEKKVSLNDDYLEVMTKIANVLDTHPDVNAFYDNLE